MTVGERERGVGETERDFKLDSKLWELDNEGVRAGLGKREREREREKREEKRVEKVGNQREEANYGIPLKAEGWSLLYCYMDKVYILRHASLERWELGLSWKCSVVKWNASTKTFQSGKSFATCITTDFPTKTLLVTRQSKAHVNMLSGRPEKVIVQLLD